jgi:hypothetical protein
MKTTLKLLLAASALCTAGFIGTVPAAAQPSGFSFRVGDVALGYQDGYYDQSRRWHSWRSQRERRWYSSNYRHQYRGMRHDRDHDGIPDRVDRDRDGDGRSNYRDSSPNNPYRR